MQFDLGLQARQQRLHRVTLAGAAECLQHLHPLLALTQLPLRVAQRKLSVNAAHRSAFARQNVQRQLKTAGPQLGLLQGLLGLLQGQWFVGCGSRRVLNPTFKSVDLQLQFGLFFDGRESVVRQPTQLFSEVTHLRAQPQYIRALAGEALFQLFAIDIRRQGFPPSAKRL